jgi:hypothetical protein
MLPETYIRENIIYNILYKTIISAKKKGTYCTAHLFIESSFTSVSSRRDQYVHTGQYNKSNEINRITAWKRKPQKLIHSNNITSVRSNNRKNRKNRGADILYLDPSCSRSRSSYHEAFFVLAMLRRSPKSLSSGFVGRIGCPEEGAVW